MITLLKEGGREVWEKQDDFRPITLLNTELKNFAWILVNLLLIVVEDLIRPEQIFIVKERLIQNNLHLICETIEGIEDDTNTALISLNQYKASDRGEYRFLVITRFDPEFCKWMSFLSAVIWLSWVTL